MSIGLYHNNPIYKNERRGKKMKKTTIIVGICLMLVCSTSAMALQPQERIEKAIASVEETDTLDFNGTWGTKGIFGNTECGWVYGQKTMQIISEIYMIFGTGDGINLNPANESEAINWTIDDMNITGYFIGFNIGKFVIGSFMWLESIEKVNDTTTMIFLERKAIGRYIYNESANYMNINLFQIISKSIYVDAYYQPV